MRHDDRNGDIHLHPCEPDDDDATGMSNEEYERLMDADETLRAAESKRPTLEDAIDSFLQLGFDFEGMKPMRNQTAAREEGMRVLGFTQAQEALRSYLEQADHPLKDTPRHPQALRPFKIGDRNGWTPPHIPHKTRRR